MSRYAREMKIPALQAKIPTRIRISQSILLLPADSKANEGRRTTLTRAQRFTRNKAAEIAQTAGLFTASRYVT